MRLTGIAGNLLTRASATLTNNVCGALSGSTAVTISGGNDATTLTAGCYQYTLTGTDNVANQATAQSTIVKVDSSVPTGGSITANGGTTFNTSGTMSLATANFTDPSSGIATNSITRASALLSGNLCGTLTGASPVTVSLGHDSATLSTGCYQYTLTGTDNAGNQATALSAVVKVDTIAPSAAATFPASGGSYNATTWNAGASSSFAGSAADAETGVSAVSISVQSASSGLCWTGTTNTFTASCPTFVAAVGTTSWTKAFPAATSFPADGAYTLSVSAADAAGNVTTTTTSFTYDTTAPIVTDVSSTLANGTSKVGTVVPVTVTFGEPVIVTGTPTLALSTGSPVTTAVSYTSGSGTAVLTFNYTVAAGNTSADLDYASTSALALSGGTIKDAATNAATVTLAAPGATHSLGGNKNLVIDGVAPVVTVTSLGSGGGASKVTVSGTATNGDGSVTVYLCHATPCSSANAVASGTLSAVVAAGTWTVTSGNIGTGTYYATATQTDAAGNTGTAGDFGPFVR